MQEQTPSTKPQTPDPDESGQSLNDSPAPEADGKASPFVCHYYHDGAQWGVTLHAYDWADAETRCRKLGLTLDGKLMARIPAKAGWLAKLVCWVRNKFYG